MSNLKNFGIGLARLVLLPVIVFAVFGVGSIHAAVNWRFHVGGMSAMTATDKEWTKGCFSALLGCEIQVPIKEKLFIESGLNLRGGPETYTYWNYDIPGAVADNIPFKDFNDEGKYIGSERPGAGSYNGMIVSLNVPLRFGYRLRLKGKNEFQFAFGPYFEYAPSIWYAITNNNHVSVGLTPSVVFKHRALSLGVLYQNTCIYNGLKNRDKNALLFTIGVNFNGRKPNMEKIAAALDATSTVLNGVNTALYGATSSGGYDGGYSDTSSSVGSGSSSTSSNNTGSNASSNRVARNRDYNTYFQYETMVIKIINGDDRVNKKKDVQLKMKALREKWVKRNDGWQASRYETM